MQLLVDGKAVFVHSGGVDLDSTRPAIVLIHGAGMDHSVWRYQARRLAAAGWAVAAPDLPGHGRSLGEPLQSIAEMGGWVGRLIEELTLRQPVVAGHSMGSLVALWVAARREVCGVVLIGTSDHMQVHPDLLAAADRANHLAVDLITGWSHTGVTRFGGHPEPGSWKRGFTDRLLERHLDRVLAVDLHAVAAHDPVADAREVHVPVLAVLGTADRMTPARDGRELMANISADTEVIEVARGSHLVFLEQPREVTAAVVDWLARRSPAS